MDNIRAGGIKLWVHEYVGHLAGEILNEHTNLNEQEAEFEANKVKLVDRAKNIVPSQVRHQAKAEVCHLWMEVEQLDLPQQYVDNTAYSRVCLHLVSCVFGNMEDISGKFARKFVNKAKMFLHCFNHWKLEFREELGEVMGRQGLRGLVALEGAGPLQRSAARVSPDGGETDGAGGHQPSGDSDVVAHVVHLLVHRGDVLHAACLLGVDGREREGGEAVADVLSCDLAQFLPISDLVLPHPAPLTAATR